MTWKRLSGLKMQRRGISVSSWFYAGHVYVFYSSISLGKQSRSLSRAFMHYLEIIPWHLYHVASGLPRSLSAGFFWTSISCPPHLASLTWIIPRQEIEKCALLGVICPPTCLRGLPATLCAVPTITCVSRWTQGETPAQQTDCSSHKQSCDRAAWNLKQIHLSSPPPLLQG